MCKKSVIKKQLLLAVCLVMLFTVINPDVTYAEVMEVTKNSISSTQQKDVITERQTSTQKPQVLQLDNNVASMTEKRILKASFQLPKGVDVKSITWTYDGKPLSQWKKYKDGGYNGQPFITVDELKVTNGIVHASITFDLVYDSLNSLVQRPLYKALMGTFDLAAEANGQVIAKAVVKLTPYDSFFSYNNLKPQIDSITTLAAQKNHRYITTTSIGQSVEGRDIYFTILAKDQATVEKYQNEIHPAMMNNPKKLQEDIKSGAVSDYKVPIWVNNIHPNETPGVSAILNYFKAMALDEKIVYNTTLENNKTSSITMNIDDVLENVFFIFVYTNNPDGLVHTTRTNANGFDLNRDNSYQTQPETRYVTEQIAKWSPISFLDMHGFDPNFLIEPCTPPHDPNVEIDLLINNMVEQAKAMGNAGIANTKYNYYYIPYEEYRKSVEDPNYVTQGTASGWDDLPATYTATFAMRHGAMGFTLETPDMNEESTKALFYSTAAATNYVASKKEELFLNQLEIYVRGVENIDNRAVDSYLVNAKNEQIGRIRQGNQNFFPEYYVLPVHESVQKNALEVYRMVEYLLRNGVKVERSTQAVTIEGLTYPAESFVINMHQAKRGIANLVLYDGIDVSDFEFISGEFIQNFHDLRGFNRYIVRDASAFVGKTQPITTVSIPETKVPNSHDYVLIKNNNNDAIKAVNSLLTAGKNVTMLLQDESDYEKGDFVVSYNDLIPVASQYYLDVKAFSNMKPSGKVLKPSVAAAFGETAYALKELGFKVTEDQISADVLINTFDSDRYVNEGKPYIAFGSMGLMNVENWIPEFEYKGPEWERYEGVFLSNVMQDNVITAPYNKQEYFYTITGSYITKVPETAEILAEISNTDDFFKAGWWPGHDDAKGHILAFRYQDNMKKLIVFTNDLINDNHTKNQFRLLANSIFDSCSNEIYVAPEQDR